MIIELLAVIGIASILSLIILAAIQIEKLFYRVSSLEFKVSNHKAHIDSLNAAKPKKDRK